VLTLYLSCLNISEKIHEYTTFFNKINGDMHRHCVFLAVAAASAAFLAAIFLLVLSMNKATNMIPPTNANAGSLNKYDGSKKKFQIGNFLEIIGYMEGLGL
jgi:hypothetical protein